MSRILAKAPRGALITLLIFVITAVIVFTWLGSADKAITREQASLLKESLYSAAVSFYAVTGRYPSLEEIRTGYGVTYDEEDFTVTYSSFASNVLPDIDVQLNREAER